MGVPFGAHARRRAPPHTQGANNVFSAGKKGGDRSNQRFVSEKKGGASSLHQVVKSPFKFGVKTMLFKKKKKVVPAPFIELRS